MPVSALDLDRARQAGQRIQTAGQGIADVGTSISGPSGIAQKIVGVGKMVAGAGLAALSAAEGAAAAAAAPETGGLTIPGIAVAGLGLTNGVNLMKDGVADTFGGAPPAGLTGDLDDHNDNAQANQSTLGGVTGDTAKLDEIITNQGKEDDIIRFLMAGVPIPVGSPASGAFAEGIWTMQSGFSALNNGVGVAATNAAQTMTFLHKAFQYADGSAASKTAVDALLAAVGREPDHDTPVLYNLYAGEPSIVLNPYAIEGFLTDARNAANFSALAWEIVSAMLRQVTHYPLDADGLAAYQADRAVGNAVGDGLIILRLDSATGLFAPSINPSLLTFSSPAGDVYSTLEVVVDILNGLEIRPDKFQ